MSLFPSNPADNDTAVINGTIYRYSSSKDVWKRIGATTYLSSDSVNIANLFPSTSTTTGALTVAGGVGIAGNLFVANVSSSGYFYANGEAFIGGSGGVGDGYTGSQGDIGYTGSAGSDGSDGAVGFTGSAGSDGAVGFTGSAGSDGAVGFTGSAGADGVDGYTGSQGPIGYTGSAAAGGGSSFDQDLNTTDNVTFANVSVTDTLTFGNLVSGGVGVPTIESDTNINLTADNAVLVTSSPLGLAGFTDAQKSSLSPSSGFVIYNSTDHVMEIYANGQWTRSASLSSVVGLTEKITISATAATGTVNFDTLTQNILYYTTDASGNWTLNIRGSSSETYNNNSTVGDARTVVFMATNGSTAYYQTALQIDGSAITPKWVDGTAPAEGNTNSVEVYSFTIIKTAASTYSVLASRTKFA